MPEYTAVINWTRQGAKFSRDQYDPGHRVSLSGGTTVDFSSAPEFRGDAAKVNPEQAFVAALSSCHMLTFLALVARRGFVVESYCDEAVGTLARNEDGRLAMTDVVLRPQVVFAADKAPHRAGLAEIHHRAHRHCFIANSVLTRVVVQDRSELPEQA